MIISLYAVIDLYIFTQNLVKTMMVSVQLFHLLLVREEVVC